MENDKKDWTNAKFFFTAFLLLLLVAAIGYSAGVRVTKSHYLNEAAATKLVYIQPYGCGELCTNLSKDARIIADEAGLRFQYVALPSWERTAGVFYMNQTFMSPIVAVNNANSLRELMWYEFGFEQFCTENCTTQ